MNNKIVATADEAVADIPDGAAIAVGGFGDIGVPMPLIDALVRHGAKNLTIIANNAGTGDRGLALLFKHGLIRRLYASFPAQRGADHFRRAFEAGEVELELVPQGTLAERLRAASAGLGGFYTPTGVGTVMAEGKEVREIDGRTYVFERALRPDVALVKAHIGDRFGNVRYRLASRNFNPVMAMAARLSIAQVERVVPLGSMDPDDVHTAGVWVDRVVAVGGGR
ncbi:MAG: 3-oxoacid CoA-transferase subunit A [Chloroflexi bacterium]|nr:3-oxoacid CoA-transferase subunit A [Chloroflexota bacterium]